MKHTFFSSAAVKLNILVFSLVCSLLVAFGAGNYYRSKADREASLHQQVDAALGRLASTLPSAVWNLDKKAMEEQLRAEMASVYLHSLTIGDAEKQLLSVGRSDKGDVGVISTGTPAGALQVTRKLTYMDGNEKKEVGEVVADVSYAPVRQKLNEDLLWATIQFAAMSIVLLLSLAFSLNRIVFRPLNRVRDALTDIASGDADLTRRLPMAHSTEFAGICSGFNQFTDRMESVVAGVRRDAGTVAMGVDQIMQGSQDLARRTEIQATNMETMSDAMGSLSGTVHANAESAQEASSLANNACDAASQGGAMMQRAIQSMGGISDSSVRIADITNVIDGIAFQTNILALNAAVEAARAGAQGRGFAVVASEVRSLAKRSADAAKEIKQLISGSVEQIRKGNEEVNAAGAAMELINNSIQQVQTIAQQMNTLTQSQQEAIASTLVAVRNIEGTTHQNAALVEETAAASESLNDSAQRLARMMDAFHTH